MQYSLIATILGLAALPAANADFMIFIGQENSLDEGGASAAFRQDIYNNPPSCNDLENIKSYSYMNQWNDASISGWACDGCDRSKDVNDMDITRMEMPQENWSTDPGSRLTIYKGDDGSYGLYDGDMKSLGSCDRITDGQDLHCATPFGVDLKQAFNCQSDLTATDSN